MKTQICAVAIGVGALLAPAAQVRADVGHISPLDRLGVSVNTYTPGDGAASKQFGDAWTGFGVTYTTSVQGKMAWQAGLGASFGGKDLPSFAIMTNQGPATEKPHVHLSLISLTYSLLHMPRGRGRGFYIGGGPGVYLGVSSRDSTATTQSGVTAPLKNTFTYSETSVAPGVQFLVGYAVTRRLSAELRHTQMLGKHTIYRDRKFDASGTSLSVSYRFGL